MEHQKNIIPFSAIPNSVEHHVVKSHKRTKAIYLTVLASLFVGFLLMFFIKTDVSVKSTGIIKSVAERNEIKAPAEGIIDSIYVQENMFVRVGQPLMKIRATALEQKGSALSQQYKDLENQIHDLELLVAGKTSGLLSSVYSQQYNLYQQKIREASNRYNLALKTYNRYAYLYQQKAISALEFDKIAFEKRAAESEYSLVREQQKSQWQTELNNLRTQFEQIKAQLGINEEFKSQYLVKAPISGTVQNLKGIQPGSVVSASEVLGEISPDSGLIAEVYVLPKDIGLLKEGNPVKMYVDAFNYNAWGHIDGKVESISSDVFTSEGQPYFKVRCRLNQTALQLKNGYKGQLKKGMTMQARFKIARRTLFQLMYDETDDWLDPKNLKNEQTASK